MPISVTPVAHGAPAFDALSAAVRRLQGPDRLAPVTIIVPTNTAGVMARRAIGRRGGAAAIDVLTLYRVADLLGAPALVAAGRKPVSTPVVDLAIKQILREHPGQYGAVAQHPSTIVALRDLFREVRLAGPAAFTALGRTPRGLEPARVMTDLARLLRTDWYDEGDLLAAAIERIRRDPPTRFQQVVVFLAERVRPLELDLLRALGDAGALDLVVGVTGDEGADETVRTIVGALGGGGLPVPDPAHRPTTDLHVVSTTDADDEVRIAVRALLDAARDGVPFDRMAVLWPTDRPYARLVEHHLDAAELPWNGRPGTTTPERLVPRALAELLELDRRGLRRNALMTLLGDVPARDAEGRPVPVAHWERIGRRAGVLRETDWTSLLNAYAAEAEVRERPREAVAALAFLAFVDEVREALGDPAATRPWHAWTDWSKTLLDRWIGRSRLDRLDGHERVAWEQTQAVLDRLAHLDSLGGPVTRAEFRATFVAELETAPARHATVGDGVHIGALGGSNGLDVDLAVVLGAADGLVPPAPSVDPLLGDDDRVRAGLVTSDERVALAHRRFLAASTAARVFVTWPRGDLRATAAHQRSRWLPALDAVADDIERTVDSHAHGLAETVFPVSASEHRLRELWSSVRAGIDVRTHAITTSDLVLGRALTLRDARASDVVTAYDGDLSTRSLPPIDGVVSPTRLEAWPACPHGYFMRYLLHVREIDEPDEIVTVTALDKGSAIHAALDRLHRLVLAGELTAPGPDGWAAEHAVALDEIANSVADELEHAGRTGRPAYWATARQDLRRELQHWMRHDAAQWDGRTIRWSEESFGDGERVELAMPDGRTIGFRGQIDRIDQLPDASLVVTDHKTGSKWRFRGLESDPTNGGTHFQLPVYAAAARVLLGEPGATVRAEYSFFEKERFKRIGIALDDDVWTQVGHALAAVVAGIESGLFPSRPERPGWKPFTSCIYCEPDKLGTAERWSEWERKHHDPRLARWFAPDDDATAAS